MNVFELLNSGEETTGETVHGVAVGIVTNNHDPDGLGRVKIKLPWRGNGDETFWARIATLMAGNSRGTYFLPEVGDEVVVTFQHGDINHPFIIGALWNGRDKPPESNQNGKNNIRKIKSRSGHEIIFNDDKEMKAESLKIHTQGGHTILLDDSLGKEKIEIKDKIGANTIVIDSVQNAITIKSAAQLKINALNIEIEAGGMMTLKAGAIMNIQGSLVKIN